MIRVSQILGLLFKIIISKLTVNVRYHPSCEAKLQPVFNV